MRLRRACVTLLSLAVAAGSLQCAVAEAALLPTSELLTQESATPPPPLTARLVALGLDEATARARVAALTPAEQAHLAARLDQLPAGGDAIGAIAFVALVLLITDILGYTDVYPFVTSTVSDDKTALGDSAPTEAAAATR